LTDLNPDLGGSISTDTTAVGGQAFSVRFDGVADNLGSSASSFVVTLYVGGHVALDFDSIGQSSGVITGMSPGGQATLNDIDLSIPGFEAHAAPLSIYQVFTPGSPFDLSGSLLLFGRVGNSGYLSFF